MSTKKVYKKIRTKKVYKNKKKKVYESLSANKKQKEYEQKKSIQKQLSLAVTNNKTKTPGAQDVMRLEPPV